nr:immunoglobulin light chain junction region [Macaca mulatta]
DYYCWLQYSGGHWIF